RLNRLVLLTPDEEGTWKVDYESFARKVDPSWDQLISGEANSGLVRVIFAQDNYFNGPFSDDQKWSCFAMASPDIEPILMGYTRIGSPQDTALRRLLLRGSRKQAGVQRVTLRIKRPADSVDRQFQITRVLAEDWVLTDQAFDRSKD
ncbi:MAG: hypothetical protein ACO3RV_05775, partial [Luteolibacter sp.]